GSVLTVASGATATFVGNTTVSGDVHAAGAGIRAGTATFAGAFEADTVTTDGTVTFTGRILGLHALLSAGAGGGNAVFSPTAAAGGPTELTLTTLDVNTLSGPDRFVV